MHLYPVMSLYSFFKYISYYSKSCNAHGIHSPFVYKLYTEVIVPQGSYYAFNTLDAVKKQALKSTQQIEVLDLGAGSKKMGKRRRVQDIAKHSVIQKKYGELLFRLVHYLRPQHVLELGTSLGISAMYMAMASKKTPITSVEACPNTFLFAQSMMTQNKQNNVSLVNASFDAFFQNLKSGVYFDFVFIDGNHTYEATMRYFYFLLKTAKEQSVFVFDDIYWTPGMAKAWQEIKSHPMVTLSLDLYKVGIVFFRSEQKQKEHFILRY
ncbi:MAG: class I SAM-dependent methyltransferase [Bacteroidetes bacterium]|nr:class I SAM-dependent methyltransferase [Bacteroidota bacterium]